MKKVWKILVVTLLAVLLLGAAVNALAEEKNAISNDAFTTDRMGKLGSNESYVVKIKLTSKVEKLTLTFDGGGNKKGSYVYYQCGSGLGKKECKIGYNEGPQTFTFKDVNPGTHSITVTASFVLDKVGWSIKIDEDNSNYYIKILPRELISMKKGQYKTLTTDYAGGLGTKTWTSSNTKVATVNQKTGTVHAVGGGKTTITVKAGGKSQKCTLYVYALNKATAKIGVKQSVQLKTLGTIDTDNVKWSSSDKTIAKVDSNGKVTGVKNGTATITATVKSHVYGETHSLTCKVTVTKPKTMKTTSSLNLRKSASDKGTILGIVNNNATVTVYYTTGNWAYVYVKAKPIGKTTYSFMNGFLSTKYLK